MIRTLSRLVKVGMRRRRSRGVVLTELLVVVVLLGVLASAARTVVPTVTLRSKRAAFATTLRHVQSGVDRFFATDNVYPSVRQPAGCPDGVLLSADAAGLDGPFVGGYLRFPPESDPVRLGFRGAEGLRVYYGVTACGRVFATLSPPDEGGRWPDPETPVYVQNRVNSPLTLAEACLGAAAERPPSEPPSEPPAAEYVLVTRVEGGGTVLRDPDRAVYPAGTTVTLTAVSDEGWLFVGWEGDLSGSANPSEVVMDRDRTVTAVFAEGAAPPEEGLLSVSLSEVEVSVGEKIGIFGLVVGAQSGKPLPDVLVRIILFGSVSGETVVYRTTNSLGEFCYELVCEHAELIAITVEVAG